MYYDQLKSETVYLSIKIKELSNGSVVYAAHHYRTSRILSARLEKQEQHYVGSVMETKKIKETLMAPTTMPTPSGPIWKWKWRHLTSPGHLYQALVWLRFHGPSLCLMTKRREEDVECKDKDESERADQTVRGGGEGQWIQNLVSAYKFFSNLERGDKFRIGWHWSLSNDPNEHNQRFKV